MITVLVGIVSFLSGIVLCVMIALFMRGEDEDWERSNDVRLEDWSEQDE